MVRINNIKVTNSKETYLGSGFDDSIRNTYL